MGPVDCRILEHLAGKIPSAVGIPCIIKQGCGGNPSYAFNDKRCQYDAKLILNRLSMARSDREIMVLGITHVDLYVPVLQFVYGLAELEGCCALISIHRLRPEYYEDPPNESLLLMRAYKTALHEVGHTFGLTHCHQRRCVMFSSTRIEHTDEKGDEFCPTCQELLRWKMERIKG